MDPRLNPPPPHAPARISWMLALPKLGVVLLVLAVISLLWLLHRNDLEEQKASLIGDVLWLEQNLRFHLSGNEGQLQQLALDIGSQEGRGNIFRLRGLHLLKTLPELARLNLMDEQGQAIDTLPVLSATPSKPEYLEMFEQAKALGRPSYGRPSLGPEGPRQTLLVPIFRHNRFTGFLLAELDLDILLRNQVPWWFAEKYRVRMIDDGGNEYATKSKVAGTPSLNYLLPLDPPGYGMGLEVTAYRSADITAQRILAVAIVGLALGVFWSLWAIRKLIRSRLTVEAALRQEHAFRQSMEDSLTAGMRARDLQGKIIYVNPAFCRMTGFSAEELIGHLPPMPYWDPEEIEETMALNRAVLSGNAPRDGFEINFRRKDGSPFRALIYESPLIDGNGEHTGWMGSVLDVTEKRRAEELARQQQEKLQFTSRLVTMGEMASTLAHELNQPLAAIASYATGCANRLESDHWQAEEIRAALDKLSKQAQRAGEIIRRVQDFVRKSEPKLQPCCLEDVIGDSLALVEADARQHGINIEYQRSEPLPPVLADRVMIEQVLLNLFRNAMDAMAATEAPLRRITVRTWQQGSEAVVAVADQGCGLPPETAQRLFEAFYTTKPDGMGIGLSICRSIIEFHRGRLWYEPNTQSLSGQGTVFAFTLPEEIHAHTPSPSGR
ncbi:sensor histidine kinase [Azovibrio restrictus]|uniref:sensor histidine kinase n=1 Tax=Azovibrio restrictus TaxID=146938 RepID=UPI0009FE4337|nr:PAS domain S-box protein [Azovibrio restrictus]